VALAQLEPVPGAIENNVAKVREVVENHQAELYIFPEMFLVGYTSKDLLYKLSQPLSSSAIDALRLVAREHRVGIVIGFPEKTDYGFSYNSLLALNERGEIYVYRKRHLPTFSVFDEARWFRAYRGRVEPWSFRGIKIGFGICYDVFFPEIFKAQVVQGAKALIAILVVDPMGNVVEQLKLFEEEVRVVDIDLNSVDRARIVRPVVRDSTIDDAYLLLESYKCFEPI